MGYDLYFSGLFTYNKKYDDLAAPRGMTFLEYMEKEIEHRYGENVAFTKQDHGGDDQYTVAYISMDQTCWYEYEENLKELTEIYPDCIFDLNIDGEESDDFRELVAKNGEVIQSYGEIKYWHREGEEEKRKAVLESKQEPSAKGFLT